MLVFTVHTLDLCFCFFSVSFGCSVSDSLPLSSELCKENNINFIYLISSNMLIAPSKLVAGKRIYVHLTKFVNVSIL